MKHNLCDFRSITCYCSMAMDTIPLQKSCQVNGLGNKNFYKDNEHYATSFAERTVYGLKNISYYILGI